MAKHAYLAASASERWLRCPPSAKLCAQEEDRGSPYAQQGTDAHELAAYLAEKALGRNSRDPTENLTWYDAEMQEAAEGGMTDVCRVLLKPTVFSGRGKLVWLAPRDIVDTCMSNAALTSI